jgi:hypothetical protein
LHQDYFAVRKVVTVVETLGTVKRMGVIDDARIVNF